MNSPGAQTGTKILPRKNQFSLSPGLCALFSADDHIGHLAKSSEAAVRRSVFGLREKLNQVKAKKESGRGRTHR